MKDVYFLIIMAAIYSAPHCNKRDGIIISMVFSTAALIGMFWG